MNLELIIKNAYMSGVVDAQLASKIPHMRFDFDGMCNAYTQTNINELNTLGTVNQNELENECVLFRFLFKYKCLDQNFNVEIEAENLNKAMLDFSTYYHQIQEIYSIKVINV